MMGYNKESRFSKILHEVRDGITSAVFEPITKGTDKVINVIDNRIIKIEKRIQTKIYSILTIVLGAVFLIFATFFYLKDFLGWSNAIAFFSIGIVIFVVGLILNLIGIRR